MKNDKYPTSVRIVNTEVAKILREEKELTGVPIERQVNNILANYFEKIKKNYPKSS